VEKSSPKICATSEILQKLSKVNNRPMGKNSANLVTLSLTDIIGHFSPKNKIFFQRKNRSGMSKKFEKLSSG
jgi:hypothetical protein